MKIEITQQKDGRYFAQYFNPNEIMLNGIGQFGETAYEAQINLLSLIKNIKKKMNVTIVDLKL